MAGSELMSHAAVQQLSHDHGMDAATLSRVLPNLTRLTILQPLCSWFVVYRITCHQVDPKQSRAFKSKKHVNGSECRLAL